jgi:hypothetical protein
MMKISNTIWSVKNEVGGKYHRFSEMVEVKKIHFNKLFKEPHRENIVDII